MKARKRTTTKGTRFSKTPLQRSFNRPAVEILFGRGGNGGSKKKVFHLMQTHLLAFLDEIVVNVLFEMQKNNRRTIDESMVCDFVKDKWHFRVLETQKRAESTKPKAQDVQSETSEEEEDDEDSLFS
jgi:hypothetical protein